MVVQLMKRRFFLSLVLAAWLFALPAWPETFTVTKEADEDGPCLPDDCALREAIEAANALPGHDTVFVPAGVYQAELGSSGPAHFWINDHMTLLGEPGTEIVGDGSDRVIHVSRKNYGDPPIDVVLDTVTVSGGRRTNAGGCISVVIVNVTIRNSLIRDCVTEFGDGGGIAAFSSRLVLEKSTVMDSRSFRFGGGVYLSSLLGLGELEMVNSTLTGNHAERRGGGGLAINNNPNAFSVINSTIAGNTTGSGAATAMGATSQGGGDLFFANNLIQGDCGLGRVSTSLGGNLESPGNSCGFASPDDQVNVPDPRLGPLSDDPVPVLPLLPGSPAIDAGVNGECPMQDQLGRPRPVDGDLDGDAVCDAGAVEAFAPEIEIPVLDPRSLAFLGVILALVGLRALRAG